MRNKTKKPEKISCFSVNCNKCIMREWNIPEDDICYRLLEARNKGIAEYEKYHNHEIRKLELKLRLSKLSEERLCPDHRGKELGQKTNCIACDVEYYSKKRFEYEQRQS